MGLLVLSNSCKKDDDNEPKAVKDGDGNVYETVVIGTQTWMAENLKTTKYNDGTPIPLISDNNSWGALTTPGFCWHDNDEANKLLKKHYRNNYAIPEKVWYI